MDMSGEYKIPAPREQVWAALNDAEVLKHSIPGAESVEKLSDTEFAAVARAKVGPVNAKFRGKVTLSDLDPPNGYTISGEGNGGAAGFAKGGAQIRLSDHEEGGTLLSYQVHATVGGKLAQVGQRFIDSTAHKMASEFFDNFSELTGGERIISPTAEPSAQEPIAPTHAPRVPGPEAGWGLNPWVWGTGIVLVMALLIWLFGG